MDETMDIDKIPELLKEMVVTQALNLKCDSIFFMREKKEQIDACVKDVKEDLSHKAKMYGVKFKDIALEFGGKKAQIADILYDYKGALEAAAEPFDEQMKKVEAKLSDAQAEFIFLAANFIPTLVQQQGDVMKTRSETKKIGKEVYKAIVEGRYDDATKGLEKTQNLNEKNQPEAVKTVAKSTLEQMKAKLILIKKCIEEKQSIKENRKAEINRVKAKKMMSLQVATKSVFRKIMGSLFNKFNGTKKFLRDAVDPLKNTITEIKDTHIPNIQASVADRIVNFQDMFENKKVDLENAIAEKVDIYAEKLATTKEGVLGNIKATKEKLSSGIKDATETAQINAMIAKGFIDDKIETAQILGMEAKDKAADKIQTAKDWVADKVETAQIYGMEAKDAIIERKNAIIEGAVNIKNSVMGKAKDVKKEVVQFATKTRDEAVQMATNTRDGVANTVTSAKDLIVKGATSIRDAGKDTYKSLINRGLQAKMNLVASMQKRLAEQQKQLQEKMQKLNPDLNNQDVEPVLA